MVCIGLVTFFFFVYECIYWFTCLFVVIIYVFIGILACLFSFSAFCFYLGKIRELNNRNATAYISRDIFALVCTTTIAGVGVVQTKKMKL